jgi:light-regulated signal transduction histidine kinase (bacteriophytochrome)
VSRAKTPLIRLPADEAVMQAQINLRTDIDGSGAEISVAPLPVVLAEYTQLVSLFQNLISNALKYRSPDRRPCINIAAISTGPAQWTFSVEDNGVGIEPQYYDKIFHIFQRLFPNDQIEGTGIGLALCRKVVHRFGGRIWVESTIGSGSTFFFTLQDGKAARRP